MLRTLFPTNHRRYQDSCCAGELEDFGAWLTASGYSCENICGHLRRLRSVLERAGEAGAGTRYSDRRLEELFGSGTRRPGVQSTTGRHDAHTSASCSRAGGWMRAGGRAARAFDRGVRRVSA